MIEDTSVTFNVEWLDPVCEYDEATGCYVWTIKQRIKTVEPRREDGVVVDDGSC